MTSTASIKGSSSGTLRSIRLALRVQPDMSKLKSPRGGGAGRGDRAFHPIPESDAEMAAIAVKLAFLADLSTARPTAPSCHPDRSKGPTGECDSRIQGGGWGFGITAMPCRYLSAGRGHLEMLDKGRVYTCHQRYMVRTRLPSWESEVASNQLARAVNGVPQGDLLPGQQGFPVVTTKTNITSPGVVYLQSLQSTDANVRFRIDPWHVTSLGLWNYLGLGLEIRA